MKYLYDIKYAFRLLVKKPLFAAVTIVIMAIGLGLSVYTYSLLNTLLYKPLDIKNSDELVSLTGRFNPDYFFVHLIDAYVVKKIREQSSSFNGFTVYYREGGTALISGRNSDFAAKKFNSSFTEWSLFEIVGVAPFMGRVLQADDHLENAEPVIVIAHSVWKDYFSSDPNIIDRVVLVDAMPTRIVGVMPKDFSFPGYAETWQPIMHSALNPQGYSQGGFVNVLARLRPGVDIDQANVDVSVTIKRFKAEYPDDTNNINAFVKPFKFEGMEQHTALLFSMSVIVGLILILACLNVGNLLLSRVNERFKEVAIRVALGVPRARLVMQMIWESIIICGAGGVLAVLFAAWGLEVTNSIIDQAYSVRDDKPYWWELGIDGDTLLVLFAVIVATILITTVIPVWRTITGDFNAVLRDGTRGALSKRSAYLSNVLVISEILLSCVVLVIAGLVMTMTVKASNMDYGVSTDNILVGTMELPQINYQMMEKRIQFYEKLQYEMEKAPNIKKLMSLSTVPGSGAGWQYLEVKGQEYPTPESRPKGYSVAALNGSLKSFGIPLLEGRYFDERDSAGGDRSAIISHSLARELFSLESAIGRKVTFHQRQAQEDVNRWYTVIGIVKDVTYGSIINSSNIVKTIYYSNNQVGIGQRFFISVRYDGSETLAKQSINNALKRVDPDVPIYDMNTYDGLLAEPLFLVKNISKLFVLCGFMAILLAASGIYAVISNSVAMRRQEIGVRRAVGANDQHIMHLFFKKSAWQLVTGIGLGVICAIGLTVLMDDYLAIHMVAYLVAYIVIPILIISIVLLATYVPTKQSIVLEPSDALHYE